MPLQKEETSPITPLVPKKDENELVFPKEIPDSTQMIVPNINFLSSPPFFVKKEKSYIYFYRTHLAQDVDVDYDPDNMLLIFKIFSHHTLSKIEMMATKLYKDEGEFQATESELTMKMICQVRVPDDTKLETIQRYDIDTELGALVEVHFERKKEIDKSNLQGKRFRHLTMAVSTTKPLQHQNLPSVTNENK